MNSISNDLLQAVGPRKFATVLADPPWQFTNRTGKMAPEHKRLCRYPTLSVQEIGEMPVKAIVEETAHLYLWVPNALLAEGLYVMQQWGFTYIIISQKREHSRKPDEQYRLVEACSKGPFIELFARGPREGWFVWGNQSQEYTPDWPTYANNSQATTGSM
ncbi:MAG: S-adenosylmethionine-binding protein, partial [Deltaproteobacteria bacterium]|nr:S-adenosylmethionine-binding protein [Deltaproteobacteria bacterium]